MKKVSIIMFLLALTFAFAEKSYAQGAAMDVFVVDVHNDFLRFSVDVTPEFTVSEMKERIYDKFNYEPSMQRIVFEGKQLDDNKTLAEQNIQHETTVHLFFRRDQ